MSERLLFYPWLRQGWATGSLPADAPGASLVSRVTLPVQLRVNSATVETSVTLLGPGDVVGIDRRQVVRSDPAPAARAFEPNFLAAIDFDRPDFPWLFTPAAASAQHRLRPWICLVVVRRQDGVTLTQGSGQPLPRLAIQEPANPRVELPNLADSWGWAHAQVAAFDSTLDAALETHPERSASRLICPRRLDPDTSYYACVVPAFEAGRLAGLGLPVTDEALATLAPAWKGSDPSLSSILLPVYYSWEFGTGAGGDFASLAKLLRPQPLDRTTGLVDLDVGEAGEGLPAIPADSPDRVLGLEGALLSPAAARKGFTTSAGAAFQAGVAALVTPPASPDEDPIVGPPLYGDRATGAATLPAPGAPPTWLRDLNVDPRYRVVAALGRQVVQRHQDEIVSSIWRQSGEIVRANTILRHAQLAKTVGESVLRRRLGPMPPDMLLQLTRPVQGRMADGAASLRLSVDAHAAAAAVSVPAFRRVARPRGRIVRSVLPPASRTVLRTFDRLATNTMVVQVVRPAGGLVTLEAVEARYRAAGGTRPAGQLVSYTAMETTALDSLSKVPAFEVRTPEPFLPPNTPPQPLAPFGASDSFSAGRLRAAAKTLQPRMHVPPMIVFGPPRPLDIAALGQTAMAELAPRVQMTARLRKIIIAPPAEAPETADPFDPVLATPEIERPMYEPLRDLCPRLMLPGLDAVRDNSAALLVTNARFVESFLLGVNHELGRELLWRGFPARSRFTYFRRFWDRRGQPGQATLPSDTPPIDQWPGAKHLGEIAEGASGQVVVLVRGELTRRYPHAIYYLVRATTSGGRRTLGTDELFPSFRGFIGSDVLFFGFAIAEAAVKGDSTDPGWYFVIQQPPGEPRFGTDAAAPAPPAFQTPETDAAATARRFLLQPVRVAIHAGTLLP